MSSPQPVEEESEQAGTSFQSQDDGSINQTKKGILKRPSKSERPEVKDTLFPLMGAYRQSPDRFPDKPGTRIPKLSVTWREKNAIAVFGDTSDENATDSENMMSDLGNGRLKGKVRQTAILDSEDDGEEGMKGVKEEEEQQAEEEDEEGDEEGDQRDETMSVASSTGSASSSIVGRWWVAKDTRFVPHCVKRGCKHSGHEQGEYLTPTQRKTREIVELKKELQNALQEKDEKERHLQELRAKLDEIEQLRDSTTTLSENRSSAQREEFGQFEKEKKAMERRHAVRVNQLVHETMQAREENTKLALRIKELEDRYVRTSQEAETMTDVVGGFPFAEITPYARLAPQIFTHENSASTLQTALSLPDMNPPKIAISSPATPMSISIDGSRQATYMTQDAINTLQAYQNEAFIWRNKAAQLEIIIRDQILKNSKEETSQEIEKLRRECQRLRDLIVEREGAMIDSGIDAPPSPQRETSHHSNSGECALQNCVERKKNLINENNALIETNEEITLRIRELEEDIQSLRRDIENLEAEGEKKDFKLLQAQKESEEKSAETTAAALVITRIQGEKETMQKAISYMEERMTAYQNVILENGFVVQDEETHNWRRGFSNPKYITAQSKKTQTTLTSEALNKHMDEFDSVQQKLKNLSDEFSAKRTDFSDRFSEIEANLVTKTKLVETLTKQLDDVRKDQRLALDQHQVERNQYKKSLEEIAKVAGRVPNLETQVEQLQQEKSEFGARFKEAKEEYEKGLEDALSESLRKYQEQSQYWKDKCAQFENTISKLKNEITQLSREKDEVRVKNKVDRAELEHRLASSIEHASQMHKALHKNQRDVEVEAKPRHTSKYVACRPNVKEKGTAIEKGDLFDEYEERLKLCQGELSTTRRQVHTLQQKLLDMMKEKNERHRSRPKIAGVLTKSIDIDDSELRCEDFEYKPELSKATIPEVDEEIHELKKKNERLHEKIGEIEAEKNRLVKEERARIQQLVAEFDNVRKELDQEISRYESEKKWLKSRINNLEKANTELERFRESIVDKSPTIMPRLSKDEKEKMMREEKIRRTFSDTDLHSDIEAEETTKLKSEVARLNRELKNVHSSITRTASVASEASRGARSGFSPAFHTLVEDINMVKGNLEKILVRIDDETVPSTFEVSAKVVKLSEEENTHSILLEEVVKDWDTVNNTSLAKDLARSRQERQTLKIHNDRLTRELSQANNELFLLRKEPINACTDAEYRPMKRSKSTMDLGETSEDKRECKRWQIKAGTLFREVHRMRNEYSDALKDRRELKIQLAMLRGELELTRIQLAEQQRRSPTSLLSHSFILNRDGRDMVKEMSVPLHFEENDLKLTNKSTPTGSQILVDKLDDSEIKRSKGLARKDEPEKRHSITEKVSYNIRLTREDLKNLDKRRKQKRSESAHSAIDQGMGMKQSPIRAAPLQKTKATTILPQCSMSQSWHAERDKEISVSDQEAQEPPVRTIHLREKVKSLTRENKSLKDKLEILEREKGKTPLPVQIVIPNRSSQIEILEQENKKLKRELKKRDISATPSITNGSSTSLDADLHRKVENVNPLRAEIEKLQNLMSSNSDTNSLFMTSLGLMQHVRATSACDESSEATSADLRDENDRLSRENLQLRSQLHEMGNERSERTTNTNRLSQERDGLKRRVELLEQQLRTSASTSSIDTSKATIDRASKTDEEIEEMMEKAKFDQQNAQKEAKLLRERIEGLERHMHTEKEQLINEHAKRVEALERGRRNVLQENSLMMQKLESMGEDIEKKKEHILKLEKENAVVVEENNCLRRKIEGLEVVQQEKESLLNAQLSKSVEELETQVTVMRKDLEMAIIKAKEANDEVDKIKAELSTNREENAWLLKENESLKENIDDLKKQLDEKQQPVQMIVPRRSNLVEKLEKEIDELKESNIELMKEVDLLKKEHTEKNLEAVPQELKLKFELTKRENEMYGKKIREMEEERADMYAVMFKKGQQAVEFEAQEERVVDQMTEDRITLRFLRDAFYYYLLNRGDEKDHLLAIMTMLNFSCEQKEEVSRKRKTPDRR
ncbi:unnamed protein product, partial [Mesorhabditis belari]|uniref:GRIP domain-containing protein n=1 Tax=Mesorhabditis belari TaxID=2138241 RepID=A0AAF3JB28_9BILA